METLSEHWRAHGMFLSDNGTLYRDNKAMSIVREDYARTHRTIENARQLCATLRAGEFSFPGGYGIAFIASDGGALCFACVRNELRQCVDSLRHNIRDGWHIAGVISETETDEPLECDHCNKTIFNGCED